MSFQIYWVAYTDNFNTSIRSFQWKLGSVVEKVSKMQFKCTDGSDEQAGTVDKRVFILLNAAPSDSTRTRNFFKEALISMFGALSQTFY